MKEEFVAVLAISSRTFSTFFFVLKCCRTELLKMLSNTWSLNGNSVPEATMKLRLFLFSLQHFIIILEMSTPTTFLKMFVSGTVNKPFPHPRSRSELFSPLPLKNL